MALLDFLFPPQKGPMFPGEDTSPYLTPRLSTRRKVREGDVPAWGPFDPPNVGGDLSRVMPLWTRQGDDAADQQRTMADQVAGTPGIEQLGPSQRAQLPNLAQLPSPQIDPNSGIPASAPMDVRTNPLGGAATMRDVGALLTPPQASPNAIPPAAAPVAGDLPASLAGTANPDPISGFLGKLLNPNNAATLLALGSGFAGAPSFGTGMRRAFSAATPAVAVDRAQQQKQASISETYKALVAKGVPPQDALAASNNPDVMKAVVGKYFEAKLPEWKQTGTDINGNAIYGWVDPNTGQVSPGAQGIPKNIASQPMGAQLQLAPDGSTAIHSGRPMIKRGRQWLYTDTNEPVKF